MKKIIAILVAMLMITCTLVGVVAQEEETENAGTTPDSVWYGFDRAMEKISLAFTFNKEKKARKKLAIAEERMNELKEMTRQGKHEYIQELINNRDKHVNETVEIIKEEETKGKNMSQVRNRLTEQHQRHIQTFSKVLEQVGNEQARQRIQANMNKSENKFQERVQERVMSGNQTKEQKGSENGNQPETKPVSKSEEKGNNQTKVSGSLETKGKKE